MYYSISFIRSYNKKFQAAGLVQLMKNGLIKYVAYFPSIILHSNMYLRAAMAWGLSVES